jgi:Protein of unknown function (DUF3659)
LKNLRIARDIKIARGRASDSQKSLGSQLGSGVMTPEPGPEEKAHTPRASQEDMAEVEWEGGSDGDGPSDKTEEEKPALPERPKSPAYVAPIPKIGLIPPISSGIPISPSERPRLPKFVGSFLVGKTVDESGDIVDEKTGQVLARVGGDLPSIVGRRVSNSQGDILGDNGELLGYVADVEIEKKTSGSEGSSSSSPHLGGGNGQPHSLFEVMGKSNASLLVDHHGNILDTSGNVVGKFHDNNNPLHRKEREEREDRQRREKKEAAAPCGPGVPPPALPSEPQPQPHQQQQQPKTRRTEDERRENAAAWRKERPDESPSDIFLDVKSTTEGIQLTIRIPTVFNGRQVQPNITFS